MMRLRWSHRVQEVFKKNKSTLPHLNPTVFLFGHSLLILIPIPIPIPVGHHRDPGWKRVCCCDTDLINQSLLINNGTGVNV